MGDTNFTIMVLALFYGLATSGVAGAALGQCFRRQGAAGFFLGALMGPAGWATVAGLPDKRPHCSHCGGATHDGANRCCHCAEPLGRRESTGEPAQQWEYQVALLESDKFSTAKLAKAAEMGWELLNVVPGAGGDGGALRLVFKRPRA